jgi:glycosyltransferase involved in cell wall biosynthesis
VGKAPIAVAIIARNAEQTIGPCVRSLLPFVEQVVVCIDETTTDKTAEAAMTAGADVREGLVVSEWHECPQHGRVLVQHFANARNRSFACLDPNIPWMMWVDADDTVEHGELLVKAIERAEKENCVSVWLPYHYSKVKDAVATLFDRERIVLRSVGWHWRQRVHEVLEPDSGRMESYQHSRTNEIAIVHQDTGHHSEASALRNILCLEIELEDNPNDWRSLFYMGNQFFALSKWEEAIHYFERSLETTDVYQKWQVCIYLSMAYEKVGNIDALINYAYRAIEVARCSSVMCHAANSGLS